MATSLVNQYISASFDKVVQISGSQLADGAGTTISSLDITVSNATSASYATSASSAGSTSTAISASHAVNADIVGLFNDSIADGTLDQFLTTNGAGDLSFDWVKTLHQNIHNSSGQILVKGTPLYISGSTGDNANVYLADASVANRRPATLIAGEDLAIGATGTGLISGEIQGVDTNLYPEGTIVYLAVGGGWTATRPTGATNLVQALGVVTRQANNGRGIIFNQIGNNLPNLSEGKLWVGDSSDYPVEVSTGSLSVASAVSASYAVTASYALNGGGGGAAFPYTGSAGISGSLELVGDFSASNGGVSIVSDAIEIRNVANKGISIGDIQTNIYGSVDFPQGTIFIAEQLNVNGNVSMNGGTTTLNTAITGSNNLIQTASASGNTITFNKFDGSSFDVTVSGGSGDAFPYTGSAGISGSLYVDGTFLTSYPALPDGTEREIFTYASVVDTKGSSYPLARTMMQDYNTPANYDNSFTTEFWDSFSYNYGNEWNVGPRGTGGYLQLSGSSGAGNPGLAILRIREAGTSGVTEGLFFANTAVVAGTAAVEITSTNSVKLLGTSIQVSGSTDFQDVITGTITSAQSATSASYATTASYALEANEILKTAVSNDATYHVPFVGTSIGDDKLYWDIGGLTFNPSTNTLFNLNVVGNVTGNLTGTASSATSASYASTATSASHALVSDTVSDANIAYINQNNTFSGTQSFNTINAVSASIAHINYVTGSATIIGDAFVVLNADTPTQRYAGLQVFDSGSSATASLEWDGEQDTWIAVEESGNTAFIITGPTGSKGAETKTTENKLQKGLGWNYIGDSNITDSGTLITLGSNTEINGALNVTSSLSIFGVSAANPTVQVLGSGGGKTNVRADRVNVVSADSSTQAYSGIAFGGEFNIFNGAGRDIALALDTTTYGAGDWTTGPAIVNDLGAASYPAVIGFDGPGGFGDNRVTFLTPISASAGITGDVTGNASTATSASYATSSGTSSTSVSASYASNASTADLATTAYNNNTSSGSIGFWQGTQAEYDLISGSASNSIIYFVI